jgi:hypothetical protein
MLSCAIYITQCWFLVQISPLQISAENQCPNKPIKTVETRLQNILIVCHLPVNNTYSEYTYYTEAKHPERISPMTRDEEKMSTCISDLLPTGLFFIYTFSYFPWIRYFVLLSATCLFYFSLLLPVFTSSSGQVTFIKCRGVTLLPWLVKETRWF